MTGPSCHALLRRSQIRVGLFTILNTGMIAALILGVRIPPWVAAAWFAAVAATVIWGELDRASHTRREHKDYPWH